VSVDRNGEEHDAYDDCNPLYVIWEEPDGTHGGSMRFLPTTGPTMLNDHFRDLLAGKPLRNPRIWECTRFCLSRNAAPRVSAALMLGGGEIGLSNGLTHSVGVFDARMTRIYSRLGWPPEVIGSVGEGRERISAGLWAFSEARAKAMCEKAGIPRALSRLWYHRTVEHVEAPMARTA
jgi:acyl homoserine lactone synthase